MYLMISSRNDFMLHPLKKVMGGSTTSTCTTNKSNGFRCEEWSMGFSLLGHGMNCEEEGKKKNHPSLQLDGGGGH